MDCIRLNCNRLSPYSQGGHVHSLTPMSLSEATGADGGAVVDSFTFSAAAANAMNGNGKGRHSLQVSAEIEFYDDDSADGHSRNGSTEIAMNLLNGSNGGHSPSPSADDLHLDTKSSSSSSSKRKGKKSGKGSKGKKERFRKKRSKTAATSAEITGKRGKHKKTMSGVNRSMKKESKKREPTKRPRKSTNRSLKTKKEEKGKRTSSRSRRK